MKFQKIVDHFKGMNLEYDWLLVLESEDDVINYHKKSDPSKTLLFV